MDNLVEMLTNLLGASVDGRMADVHVAIPGRVETYDAALQKASVQPLVMRAHEGEDGGRVAQKLPVIPEVPVLFPGGGDFMVTFPIQRGDVVLLVFSEASLDKFLVRDGIVDPQDDRRHNISDAIAIPGLRNFKSPRSGASSTAMIVGPEAGSARIELDGSTVKAGGSAPLVTVTEFNNHTHTCAGAGSPSSPPVGGATGTAFLRGFVVVQVLLMLGAIAAAYLLGAA